MEVNIQEFSGKCDGVVMVLLPVVRRGISRILAGFDHNPAGRLSIKIEHPGGRHRLRWAVTETPAKPIPTRIS